MTINKNIPCAVRVDEAAPVWTLQEGVIGLIVAYGVIFAATIL